MVSHKKEYGVYYWDTFDNETMLIDEFDDFDDAVKFIEQRYKGHIGPQGADRVEIVSKEGKILEQFQIF